MFSINTPFLDYRMDIEMTRLASPSLEFKLSKHILSITCRKYNTGLILTCFFFMKMCMVITFSEKKNKQTKKNKTQSWYVAFTNLHAISTNPMADFKLPM